MTKAAKRINLVVVIALIMVFIFLISMNTKLIMDMMVDQIGQLGQTRLEIIKSDFEGTFNESVNSLIKVSSEAEQLLDRGCTLEELEEYIIRQKQLQYVASKGVGFNLYIASPSYTIIPDFDMPEDYHAVERLWYVGAASDPGIVYVTEPYIDSMTKNLCYTLSVTLSDEITVVGMDFTLSHVQDSVKNMSDESGSTAMIVTKEGMIVGYTDMSYAGKMLDKTIPVYSNILKNIIAEDKKKSIKKSQYSKLLDASYKININDQKCIVFHAATQNGWYMLLSVNADSLYSKVYRQIALNIVVNLVMLISIIIFYIYSIKNRTKAEEALKSRERFISGISENINDPLKKILLLSDPNRINNSSDIKSDMSEIKASCLKLSELVNNLNSYSSIVSNINYSDKYAKKYRHRISNSIRLFRNIIILILAIITFFSIFFIVKLGRSNVKDTMNRNLNKYYLEYLDWETEQKTVLNMFSDSLSAQPELLNDYERAVKWMDTVAKNYSNISVCYMANPYKEHTVIMNNGWQPDEDWKVEEREWYKETEKSPDGFSISAPYYDEQTGNYCITMSKIVYSENNEFLGLFGIDFYMDKLISIFGNSYSDDIYVFMTDSNGDIVNHPYSEYQMSVGNKKNITDTVYKDVYLNNLKSDAKDDFYTFTDLNGKYSVCYFVKDEASGFTIFVVSNWLKMNIMTIMMIVIYVLVIVICAAILIILINRVISSQSEMNERLTESAKIARSADKAKSDFLAQMSHEIRTPINAVIGMDEMILRESNDENILDYADNIKRASNTLLSLINGILDFSKIESGKMEIIEVRYDTINIIDDLVHMVSERAAEKGLELKLDINPGLPSVLYGDDVRIKQIITNLLSNAVKYTKEGTVTLRLGMTDNDGNNCKLYVSVEDTGIGIRKEDVDKLSVSFNRLDEVKNRNIEGTGLGMSIVYGLLSMMGSRLHCESEYGQGSKFSFELVQKIVDANTIGNYSEHRRNIIENKKAAEHYKFSNVKALVVDDNEMNLKVVKGLMKTLNIVPDLAISGRKCIEEVKKTQYDIIFMDHMMPGTNGIETLHILRSEQLIPDSTIVVALTANAIVGAKEMYISEGFNNYMSKPIDSGHLERMLAEYLPDKISSVSEKKEYQNMKTGELSENSEISESNIKKEFLGNKSIRDVSLRNDSIKDDSIRDDSLSKDIKTDNITNGTNEYPGIDPDNYDINNDKGTSGTETSETENTGIESSENKKADIPDNENNGSFLDILNSKGINTASGLKYCINDEEFYREILGAFVDGSDEKLKVLDEAYKTDNWMNYQINVHSLKSSAKTIGADDLSAQALEHENAAKELNAEFIKQDYENLICKYKETLDVIKGCLQ